ncbi:Fc.00g032960.m01.CDS01 [Cosmosporella sp. VM-42]
MASDSFELFPWLPVELQDYIWDFALHASFPRTYFATFAAKMKAEQEIADGQNDWTLGLQRTVPPTFALPCLQDPIDMGPKAILRQTCRASREIALDPRLRPAPLEPMRLDQGRIIGPPGTPSKTLRQLGPPPLPAVEMDGSKDLLVLHWGWRSFTRTDSWRRVPFEQADIQESTKQLKYLGITWSRSCSAFYDPFQLGGDDNGLPGLFVPFPKLRVLYGIVHPKKIRASKEKPWAEEDSALEEYLGACENTNYEDGSRTFNWRDMEFYEVPKDRVSRLGGLQDLLSILNKLRRMASDVGGSHRSIAVRVLTFRVVPVPGRVVTENQELERTLYDLKPLKEWKKC